MRRYRCLVVDDEDLIIQRLEQFFSGFPKRFELVGKAHSGAEAKEMALLEKPDIILTDIVMPQMDGLELIEALKPELANSVFIILTAYADFAYAKRALQFGVTDYLIKMPLIAEDILRALEKAAQTIKEREHKEAELQSFSQSRLENVYRFRRQLFTELLRGECSVNQVQRRSDELKLSFNPEAYCCFVMEDSEYKGFVTQYNEADQSVLKYALLNISEETITQHQSLGFVSELTENCYLGIVSRSNMHSVSQHHQFALELGLALVTNAKSFLKRNINISISKVYSGWLDIRSAYQEAQDKLAIAYYEEPGTVISPSYSLKFDPNAVEIIRKLINQLTARVQQEVSLETLMPFFGELRKVAKEKAVPREIMMDTLRQMLLSFKNEVQDRLEQAPAIPLLDGLLFEAQMVHCKAFIEVCFHLLHQSRRPEIRKAKQYIGARVTERCSLDEVAKHVNLAPTYFSALFRREEGETLVDYMNRCKIEKAIELLKEGDYTNGELSEKIGMWNEKYFCTLFKQLYGLPPQKFRKKYL